MNLGNISEAIAIDHTFMRKRLCRKVVKLNGEDYICLTDMLRAKDGDFFITDWLRNRNTLEFIGIWEKMYNPEFNYGEFAIIRNQSHLNKFHRVCTNMLKI